MSKKVRYRIISTLRENGKSRWNIQKLTRLFWIGPLIWETFDEGEWEWRWWRSWGYEYRSLESAKKALDEILEEKIVKQAVVKETETS